VISKYSLVVNLVKPNPNIPYALTINQGEVESPSAVAKAKADPTNDYLSSHTDGAGMYVLSQFSEGNSCTYVPNKYYYNQRAIKWSKITWRNVASPTASLAALQQGSAQVWYSADPGYAGQAASAGLNVVVGKGSGGAGGSFGIEFFDHGKINPALGSVKVRQALNYAVNRNAIVQGVFSGKYCTASDLPNYGSDGDDQKYNNYYPYNPAKAKQLLTQAGYPHGFTFSIIVDSSAGSGFGSSLSLAQAVAGELAKVGVTMKVVQEPGGAFGTALSSKKYDGWLDTLGPIPMYTWYLLVMVPNGPVADQHGWSDPVVDRLWAKGSTQSGAAAKATWVAMSNRVVTQAEELPICAQAGIIVSSKHIGGIASTGHRQGYENLAYDWYYK
jgi:peptide/nickel transport system substrate-binding protein